MIPQATRPTRPRPPPPPPVEECRSGGQTAGLASVCVEGLSIVLCTGLFYCLAVPKFAVQGPPMVNLGGEDITPTRVTENSKKAALQGLESCHNTTAK